MKMWIVWLVFAVIFAIIEIFTPSFFIIWFAAGAIGAAILSLFTHNILAQLFLFIIISFLCIINSSRLTKKLNPKVNNFNSDALIGKTGVVTSSIKPLENKGRIKIAGQDWKAICEDEKTSIEIGENVMVKAIDGVTLIVTKMEK